jgi:hypothetical protein
MMVVMVMVVITVTVSVTLFKVPVEGALFAVIFSCSHRLNEGAFDYLVEFAAVQPYSSTSRTVIDLDIGSV